MSATDPQRRWGRQSYQGRGKLTPSQRDEITRRKAEGEDPRTLALEFGVTAAYVREMF